MAWRSSSVDSLLSLIPIQAMSPPIDSGWNAFFISMMLALSFSLLFPFSMCTYTCTCVFLNEWAFFVHVPCLHVVVHFVDVYMCVSMYDNIPVCMCSPSHSVGLHSSSFVPTPTLDLKKE